MNPCYECYRRIAKLTSRRILGLYVALVCGSVALNLLVRPIGIPLW